MIQTRKSTQRWWGRRAEQRETTTGELQIFKAMDNVSFDMMCRQTETAMQTGS